MEHEAKSAELAVKEGSELLAVPAGRQGEHGADVEPQRLLGDGESAGVRQQSGLLGVQCVQRVQAVI